MRARIFSAAAVLCLLSNAASAQTSLPSASLQMGLPSAPLQSGLPSAPLQMTLPSASLPDATPDISVNDLYVAGAATYAPRFDRLLQPDPRFIPCCGGSFGSVFVPLQAWRPSHGTFWRDPQRRGLGYLQVVVQPGTAQVYIDDVYVGTVDDLGRMVLLDPRSHRVEIRAAGYRSVMFDVRIAPNEIITYRADLEPMPPAEKPAAVAAAVPKTFYVIPNCYAGDKPPVRSRLPRGCDAANVRTIPPVVIAVR